jgi:hypothetical protein
MSRSKSGFLGVAREADLPRVLNELRLVRPDPTRLIPWRISWPTTVIPARAGKEIKTSERIAIDGVLIG